MTSNKRIVFAGMATALLVFVAVFVFFSGEVSWLKGSDAGTVDISEEMLWADSSTTSIRVAEAIAEPAPPPEGYIEYRNEHYGFLFYHSPRATVREVDEGQGAMTVVVENEVTARGLQIFIVPYTEEVISEERFRLDVPSGVVNNLEATNIGELGVPAITFNGHNQFLGETREVWFIYGGFLFEVTTFKGMPEWFAPIMQTWRFLR